MMKCIQTTTFAANGQAIRAVNELVFTPEADEPRQVESQVLDLYPDVEYQSIEGFGGAMTESSASLFSGMDAATRKAALLKYFGPEGWVSFVRTHVDSCDFALSEYQAVADPIADPELKTFTIDRDRKYIIPMLKEAIALSPRPVSVLLSPWSPPAQWKTENAAPKNDASVYGGASAFFGGRKEWSGRTFGGSLKHEYYGPWATYLVKYV
jgi:glucosylceramidase